MRGKKSKAIRKAAAMHNVDAKFVKQLAKRGWKNRPVSDMGQVAALVSIIMGDDKSG